MTADKRKPAKGRTTNELSDDAKVILGGWFGMGLTEVSFAMREGRPTARAQAAINECVKSGVLWREPHAERGFRLKPCHDCEPYGKWLKKNRALADWPIMETLTPQRRRPR